MLPLPPGKLGNADFTVREGISSRDKSTQGQEEGQVSKGQDRFLSEILFFNLGFYWEVPPTIRTNKIRTNQILQVSLPIQVILICDKLALIPSFYVPSTDPDQYDFP